LDGPSRNFHGFREDLHASSAARAAEDILARKDAERRAAVLAEVGSEEAVWVKTEREIALGLACRWLLRCSSEGKDVVDSLMGWRSGSYATMPREVRNAMAGAFPLPSAVHEAWAEFLWWEKLVDHRRAFCPVYSADVRVCARIAALEHLLDSLPDSAPQDL
jgi:hypothetical protein